MASVLNKRQQARNERTLQELIKTVPGNSVCADCGARNPGWASWSVGVFLCLRCAALHRKLGTHISKVKSLSMDKWDNAQVDNMKRVGNVESNKLYNPRNVKPQIPIDVDEVDSAMERFVRQKYEQRVFMNDSRPGTRSNTGSSSSVEDRPPPLPPKPAKRFGFGITKSSTFPGNVTPPTSPGRGAFNGYGHSPPMVNKPSRIFGSNVNTSGDGLDSKLSTLKDMGFHDEKRNSMVLKSLNGNLDKAVEALIKLGETGKSRASTPTPAAKGPNGLSFERTQTAPAGSMNPFEALDNMPQRQPPQIQTQLNPYGGAMTQPTSPSNSYNPFLSGGQPGTQHSLQGYPQQQQQQHFVQHSNPFGVPQGLEQSFQGMQLSNQQPQQLQQPQQPLFPNRTGGYGPVAAPFAQSNPFAQSFTPPPMPQAAQQYGSNYQLQAQQQQQPLSTPTSPGNPFLKSSRSQMFTPTTVTSSNPFGQPLQQQQQPQQQVQQQGQNPFLMQQQQFPQAHSPSVPAPNPFDTQQQQQSYQQPYQQQNPYQQSYQQQPQQTPNYQQQQQQNYQQNQTLNQKNSILALYNYPHLAPQQPEQLQTPSTNAQQTPTSPPRLQPVGQMNPFAAATQAPPQQQQQQQQQVASAVPPQVQQGMTRHVSHDSIDFSGLMGGRHSPDAFSGLSSSFRR